MNARGKGNIERGKKGVDQSERIEGERKETGFKMRGKEKEVDEER